MGMNVVDINGIEYIARTIPELEDLLMKKNQNGVNSFLLSFEKMDYPQLSLLVKGELATLTFFPEEESAGLASVGSVSTIDLSGETTFSLNEHSANDLSILNDKVVSFSTALEVAKEFFVSKSQPQSIEWYQPWE